MVAGRVMRLFMGTCPAICAAKTGPSAAIPMVDFPTGVLE